MTAFARLIPSLAIAAALAASTAVHAQAAAPIDADKQKQIDRILAVVHPENAVLQAIQQQGVQALQQSSIALQANQVSQERKDKTLKEIKVDVQKYIDTTMPTAIASAKKNTPLISGPILAANFSTDELRQVAAMLESPLRARLEKVLPQMQDAVGQTVSAEMGSTINKNAEAMTEAVGSKLRVAATLK